MRLLKFARMEAFEEVCLAIPVTEETGGSAPSASAVLPPSFLCGDIIHKAYDGITDDLLTGGLGHEGIQSITPPGFADPVAPTAQELRRRAIYDAYSGLVDRATGGGFGVYFGPVTTRATRMRQPLTARIAGDEFLKLRRQRRRCTEPRHHPDGAGPHQFRLDQPLYADGRVIRFTRHLWCGAYRRRMGPQASLRRRLHRQGGPVCCSPATRDTIPYT